MINAKLIVKNINKTLINIKHLAKKDNNNETQTLYNMTKQTSFVYDQVATQNNMDSNYKMPILKPNDHFLIGKKLRTIYKYHLGNNVRHKREDAIKYDKIVLNSINDKILYVINDPGQYMPCVAQDSDIINADNRIIKMINNHDTYVKNTARHKIRIYLGKII